MASSTSTRAAGSTGSAGYLPYLIPGAVGFIAVVIGPFIMNIGASFTRWNGIGRPRFVGFDNYERLLVDSTFWEAVLHAIASVIAMSLIPLAIGLILAAVLFDYISSRFGAQTSSALRAAFYLPQILPVAVAGLLWGWILNPIGVLNALLDAIGLHAFTLNWIGDPKLALLSLMGVMVWLQLGYALVIFMAGLSRVDPAYYEAAEIDGASWFTRFRAITIPMLKPEIFVVGLTTTIAALKVFAPVFVLTEGGPGDATTVPSYLAYYHFFTTNRVGYGAAITTIQMLITVVLGLIFLRVQSRQTEEAD
jgi:raffinose/stachyose/melibiose transport system permease protein